MKAVVVIAFLIASVSFAECSNFHKSVGASANRLVSEQKRAADDFCYLGECVAAGTKCTQSAACKSCNDQFYTCVGTNPDTCACGTQFVQCALTNATDDKHFCNPTIIYNTCKSLAPTCGCGNFTQNVPIPTCNYESFCNNATGSCQAKTGEGQFCVENEDCGGLIYDSTSYTCMNNKCEVTPYTASIGDACSVDEDCVNAFTDEVSCTNGVCVGQNQGGNCTNTGSCNYGLYCNNTAMSSGMCVPLLKEGDTCDTADDNCGYPTVCGFGDKCTKAFSKAKGQSCESDVECQSGNPCINNVCAAPPAAKECTADSDCPVSQGYTGECSCTANGKHMCEINSGIGSCFSQLETLYTCIADNSCNGFDLSNDCVNSNCNNQVKCVYTCSLEAGGLAADCYPSLTCASSTTGTTGSGVATQVSMGLVALSVAASLAL